MHNRDLELQLNGYGLITAHILYHLPDHPAVLQTYVWQQHDLAPEFPEMHRFLDFWRDTLDGRLHSVRYAYRRLVGPQEWRSLDGEMLIN